MKTPNTGKCLICETPLIGKRPDAKYCSEKCANRKNRKTADKQRTCINDGCNNVFQILTVADANRRYCSRQCARRASEKKISGWKKFHPQYMKEYNRNRIVKNPGAWKEKYDKNRSETIELLGGKCIVCGVNNPFWLHLDYIPTTRGKPTRHSRHIGFIKKHIEDFRILCANHHYELTITGKIEGTDIVQ